jgi:hypothetical protein
MSDFPEFDRAYKTVLVKDKEDRFEQLAAEANFNVYHSDIWRGTGRKFAELIVRECLEQIDKIRDGCEADKEYQQALGADWAGLAVARHFGVK